MAGFVHILLKIGLNNPAFLECSFETGQTTVNIQSKNDDQK